MPRSSTQQVITRVDFCEIPVAPVLSPDGGFLALLDVDADVTIWDTSNGDAVSVLRRAHPPAAVRALAMTHNAAFVAVAVDNVVELWTCRPDRESHKLNLETPADTTIVAFDTTGQFLAAGTAEGHIYLWSILGEPLRTWHVRPANDRDDESVIALQFLPKVQPKGPTLIAVARSGAVRRLVYLTEPPMVRDKDRL